MPGVTVYPNGNEMREIRSTSLISNPKENSSHVVVLDLTVFPRVFKYSPLSKESMCLPKQGPCQRRHLGSLILNRIFKFWLYYFKYV